MTVTWRTFLSTYRWPIFLAGILLMSMTAQGVLVYVATRPAAPRPIANYYQQALNWDVDASVLAASRQLGWEVSLNIPEGQHYEVAQRRPVDVVIHDRDGAPVTGLVGQLLTVRPSDTRLNGTSSLTELPHKPGHYRTLASLSAPGVWELRLDTTWNETRFVHKERTMVQTVSQQTP